MDVVKQFNGKCDNYVGNEANFTFTFNGDV